jgi:hypothetical protein
MAASLGFATVAASYNTKRSLGLTPQEIADLAQYLKSQ